MNKYAEKYPNVFLTQGLIDLVQYGLTDPTKETIGRKLKVVAQIFDEADGLDEIDRSDEPIGLDSDPLAGDVTPPAITEADLPPDVLQYMQENDLTIGDLMSEGYDAFDTGEEPQYMGPNNFSLDMADDEEMEQQGGWQEELKKWFGNGQLS